jgi:hypothetical protein
MEFLLLFEKKQNRRNGEVEKLLTKRKKTVTPHTSFFSNKSASPLKLQK